jgi:dTDP-4-dehydrorhamnose 3,5-epimerase
VTNLEISKTTLDKVLLIKPSVFEDFRGTYVELYNEEAFRRAGIDLKFVQDDVSISSKNVLRGLHGDSTTWKLISCLHGKIYFVVVNCDEGSSQYHKWESFTLSDRNKWQVLVPPKFANGHLVLSDEVVFHYKQTTYYDPKSQFTIRWDDPKIKVWWPIKNPILSQRDDNA